VRPSRPSPRQTGVRSRSGHGAKRHVDAVVSRIPLSRGDAAQSAWLDAVEHNRPTAVGEKMSRDYRVDASEPPARFAQVSSVERCIAGGLRQQIVRYSAGIRAVSGIRSRIDRNVQTLARSIVEEFVEIANSGEVVYAGTWRVVAPKKIDCDGVIAVGAYLV
jgi:hypothetical protein